MTQPAGPQVPVSGSSQAWPWLAHIGCELGFAQPGVGGRGSVGQCRMGFCILATLASTDIQVSGVSRESQRSISWGSPVHGSHLYSGHLTQSPIPTASSFPHGGEGQVHANTVSSMADAK